MYSVFLEFPITAAQRHLSYPAPVKISSFNHLPNGPGIRLVPFSLLYYRRINCVVQRVYYCGQ
jgi:hypothetical protein